MPQINNGIPNLAYQNKQRNYNYPNYTHPNFNYPNRNYNNYAQPQPNFNYPNFAPPRPPKPQPKPEPMDTSTIHSGAVNYQNRPQPFKYAGKRTQGFNPSVQNMVPQKIQRNFHINSENPVPSSSNIPPDFSLQPTGYISPNDAYAFYQNPYVQEAENDPDLNSYMQEQIEEQEPEADECDIHFLG